MNFDLKQILKEFFESTLQPEINLRTVTLLSKILETESLADTVHSMLCYNIVTAAYKCRHMRSQKCLLEMIKLYLTGPHKYADVCLRHFTRVFVDYQTSMFIYRHNSRNMSISWLNLLRLLCHILKLAATRFCVDTIKLLYHLQARCLYSIVDSDCIKNIRKAEILLHSQIKDDKLCRYLEYSKSNNSSWVIEDYTLFTVVAFTLEKNDVSCDVDSIASGFVQCLCDQALTSSTRDRLVSLPAVSYCCRRVLLRVSPQQLQQKLFPAVARSMLRVPERALPYTVAIIGALHCDYSACAPELCTHILPHVTNTDPYFQSLAFEFCESFGSTCNDADALVYIGTRLLDMLCGASGVTRVTVTAHRQSIWQALGSLCEGRLRKQEHSSLVTLQSWMGALHDRMFVRMLSTCEMETNQATLIFALLQLRSCCCLLAHSCADMRTFIKWFLKIHETRLFLAVRMYLLSCLCSFLYNDHMEEFRPLLRVLQNIFNQSMNTGDVNAVYAASVSARILLRIYSLQSPERFATFFHEVIESNCCQMSSLVLNFSDFEGHMNMFALCETLLKYLHDDNTSECTDDQREQKQLQMQLVYTRASHYMVSLLLNIRVPASTRKHTHARDNTTIYRNLVVRFSKCVNSYGYKFVCACVISVSDCFKQKYSYQDHRMAVCLYSICSHSLSILVADQNLLYNLLFDVFLLSHHHILIQNYNQLWISLAKRVNISLEEFFAYKSDDFTQLFKSDFSFSESLVAGLRTLCSLHVAHSIIDHLVDYACELLNSEQLYTIEQVEFEIYMTPDGVLYDTSVKNQVFDDKSGVSMKEVLEEREILRAVEKSRSVEGKTKCEILTVKQKEAVNRQLEKEKDVRTRLTNVDQMVEFSCSILSTIQQSNALLFRQYLSTIVPVIVKSLTSKLAAVRTRVLWQQVCFSAYQRCHQYNFCNLVISSVQDVDARNFNSDFDTFMSKFSALKLDNLSSATFNVTWPTLKRFLMSSVKQKSACNFTQQLLDVVKVFIVFDDLNGLNSEHFLLPRDDFITVLSSLIEESSPKIQEEVESILLFLAKTVSPENNVVICKKEFGDKSRFTCSVECLFVISLLYTDSEYTKLILLKYLDCLTNFLDMKNDISDVFLDTITATLFVLTKDSSSLVLEKSEKLIAKLNLSLLPSTLDYLLNKCTCSDIYSIQKATADLLHSMASDTHAQRLEYMLERLQSIYEQYAVVSGKVDSFGRTIEQPIDHWQPRLGVALALQKLVAFDRIRNVSKFMNFFVLKALNDKNEKVQEKFFSAAITFVDVYGKVHSSVLFPIVKNRLNRTANVAELDTLRRFCVVLMGTLAKHMDPADPAIKPMFNRLLQTLDTPSQMVQTSTAQCLQALVPAVKDEMQEIFERLLKKLLGSGKYSVRRGAAHGLAGLLKGTGVLGLKQFGVMVALTEAIQGKKDYKPREGALFAFTMICQTFGRLFEPYIIHVLPHLLACFGDTCTYVREAAAETSHAVMSSLSGHGVKLVLPILLAGLEEDSWRTKAGSVLLLGSMSHCAPKQLSTCLPSIVPHLVEVLRDSHDGVRDSGVTALTQLGSVIRNPEIQGIVDVLILALSNPSDQTYNALSTLTNTRFIHFIDAPSLALVTPVIKRAFQDRSSEVRKMASQIVGNMFSLTDSKDLLPYLPSILPGLKQSLLDPVPEVRSTTARALGSIVKGLDETMFQELMRWLQSTLTSSSSSVDRSGAAQGLSELVFSMGESRLQTFIPEIKSITMKPDVLPHVKDGYLMLLIYLPMVFGEAFKCYLDDIIPVILKALADETEYVRDTALRAGQRVVLTYAKSSVQLLLPQLQRGLFDENWRIRLSSVQLIGDLLYNISGVSGKMSTETAGDDDNFGTETCQKSISQILGTERCHNVLTGLYIGRQDVSLMVRQASLHVWKIIVSNTPRTLREILPVLFSKVLSDLTNQSNDQRQAAARTLGDLVRKLGERIVPEIIPIFEQGIRSDDTLYRQGVCVGLGEILQSTSRDTVQTHTHILLPTLRRAICDPELEIRSAASTTFESLHRAVGSQAVDEILPFLMEKINAGDEPALSGLCQLMTVKSNVFLPSLIPRLHTQIVDSVDCLVQPSTFEHNVHVLAEIVCVTNTKALNAYISRHLVPVLLTVIRHHLAVTSPQSNDVTTFVELPWYRNVKRVIVAISDLEGVNLLVSDLMSTARVPSQTSGQPSDICLRRAAVLLLSTVCQHTSVDLNLLAADMLQNLIIFLSDADNTLLSYVWDCLTALVKPLHLDAGNNYVHEVNQGLRVASSTFKNGEFLPGLSLSRGVGPLTTILRTSLLSGSTDLKEMSASTLLTLLSLSTGEALRTSTVHIAGPLIRVLGERLAPAARVSMLECLRLLLARVHVQLRPFLPQLHVTFTRALAEPHKQVRVCASQAVGALATIHSRVPTLVAELLSAVKSTTDDVCVRDTYVLALRSICTQAGHTLSSSGGGGAGGATIHTVTTTLLQHVLDSVHESSRLVGAGCLGYIAAHLSHEQLKGVLLQHVCVSDYSSSTQCIHGRLMTLAVMLRVLPDRILDIRPKAFIEKFIMKFIASEEVCVVFAALTATAHLLVHVLNTVEHCGGGETLIDSGLLQAFASCGSHVNTDVRHLVVCCVHHVSVSCSRDTLCRGTSYGLFARLAALLIQGCKEKGVLVKNGSESALCALLGLATTDSYLQILMPLLDISTRTTLDEIVAKLRRKGISSNYGVMLNDITLIT